MRFNSQKSKAFVVIPIIMLLQRKVKYLAKIKQNKEN